MSTLVSEKHFRKLKVFKDDNKKNCTGHRQCKVPKKISYKTSTFLIFKLFGNIIKKRKQAA